MPSNLKNEARRARDQIERICQRRKRMNEKEEVMSSKLINYKEYEKLTRGEKFIVDWQYGNPSHFKKALKKLMVESDNENLGKLSLAFPDEGEAFRNYRHTPGWWEKLDERVTKSEDEKGGTERGILGKREIPTGT